MPKNIQALDKRLSEKLTEDQQDDPEYWFRVIYTLEKASKSKAHIEFIKPDSAEGREIHNVLERRVLADGDYPYKPAEIAKNITTRLGKLFTIHDHTQAWKKHRARPKSGSKDMSNTNPDWCIYHTAHKDYTYSQRWVDFITQEIGKNP